MGVDARRVALLAVLIVIALPNPAQGLSLPVSGGTLLAFGATYAEGGRTLTHRGVDLACSSGDAVRSPCEGRVSFAGRIPGSEGGTVLAVTLETADGLKLTLLPLERAAVAVGDAVSAGMPIGEAAAGGDVSSPSPHVHLSARRGELYLDPAPLLEAPQAEVPSSELAEPPAEPVVAAPPPAVPLRPTSPVAVAADPAGVRGAAPQARANLGSAAGSRTRAIVPAGPVGVGISEPVAHMEPSPPQPSGVAAPFPPGGQRVAVSGVGDVAWALAAAGTVCALVGVGLKGTIVPARARESGAV